jgi:phosphopantetheinyl transferase
MPLAFKKALSESATLSLWHLTESSEELAAGLEHSELYAEKVAGLKPESRRLREILAARCLLNAATGREWAVVYDADGRPAEASGGAVLSISHTEGHVAVLTSTRPTARLGIDIERMGRRIARVAERFLVPSELSLLAEAEAEIEATLDFRPDAEKDAVSLHLAWSAKETAYKVLGTSYYDLQHKTTITRVDAAAHILEMHAEGVAEPLRIAYRVAREYVLTYLAEES